MFFLIAVSILPAFGLEGVFATAVASFVEPAPGFEPVPGFAAVAVFKLPRTSPLAPRFKLLSGFAFVRAFAFAPVAFFFVLMISLSYFDRSVSQTLNRQFNVLALP
jgi:hypothetical protein